MELRDKVEVKAWAKVGRQTLAAERVDHGGRHRCGGTSDEAAEVPSFDEQVAAGDPEIAVSEDRGQLVQYLTTKGGGIDIGAGGWVVVELEGSILDASGHDGELLIEPSRIVAVTDFEDLDMYDRIGDAYDVAQPTC